MNMIVYEFFFRFLMSFLTALVVKKVIFWLEFTSLIKLDRDVSHQVRQILARF